jgi:hypothetical protein
VHREVSNGAQLTVKEARKLYLYKEKIKTKYREFRLEDVSDMSYKELGEEEGFLYLHTNQGVFPFMVSVNPQSFMDSYFKLVKPTL